MIDNRVWLLHIKEEADLIIQTMANLTEKSYISLLRHSI